MSIIGNLLWLIFGGFFSGILWFIAGVIWCITIVGIPVGVQCFKYAGLVMAPFGKDVAYSNDSISFILNILWIIFSGAELAIWHLVVGIVLSATIIGIPFGLQHFKLARLAFMPFGTNVR